MKLKVSAIGYGAIILGVAAIAYIDNAIRDYLTGGRNLHKATDRKVMIVVSK